jgi:hypothetical protein
LFSLCFLVVFSPPNRRGTYKKIAKMQYWKGHLGASFTLFDVVFSWYSDYLSYWGLGGWRWRDSSCRSSRLCLKIIIRSCSSVRMLWTYRLSGLERVLPFARLGGETPPYLLTYLLAFLKAHAQRRRLGSRHVCPIRTIGGKVPPTENMLVACSCSYTLVPRRSAL